MKLQSERFGTIPYEKDEIIFFDKGLCGFPEHRAFLLLRSRKTDPIYWLLSVDDPGLALPVIRPGLLSPDWSKAALPIAEATSSLGCRSKGEAQVFCIVSLPRDLKQMSINLRAPIVVNPGTRKGLQYCEPGIRRLPVRRPIYHELTAYTEARSC